MCNKPIILDNAVKRTGENSKCFNYDYQNDINVVNFNGSVVPFIESNNHKEETVTITRVERESDDVAYSLLELESKTFKDRERDDEAYSLQELKTVTEVQAESDDEAYSALELMTKTDVKRERDDEESITFN